jgi:hypothetical protein
VDPPTARPTAPRRNLRDLDSRLKQRLPIAPSPARVLRAAAFHPQFHQHHDRASRPDIPDRHRRLSGFTTPTDQRDSNVEQTSPSQPGAP